MNRPFIRNGVPCVLLWLLAVAVLSGGSAPNESTPAALAGTWTGTSTCIGNRPACKNETVVYRFLPIAEHPGQVRLLADKIIEGKRVAMGALVFDYDQQAGELRCEFRRGTTHGVWSYTVVGDSLTGQLVVLPEQTVARDVKAARVADSGVPEAPPLSEYDEQESR